MIKIERENMFLFVKMKIYRKKYKFQVKIQLIHLFFSFGINHNKISFNLKISSHL